MIFFEVEITSKIGNQLPPHGSWEYKSYRQTYATKQKMPEGIIDLLRLQCQFEQVNQLLKLINISEVSFDLSVDTLHKLGVSYIEVVLAAESKDRATARYDEILKTLSD